MLNGTISAIRVVESELGWQVDDVSPEVEDAIKRVPLHYFTLELIAFVEHAR